LFPGDKTALAGKTEIQKLIDKETCLKIVGKWFVNPNGRTWTVYEDNTVYGTWLIFNSTGNWKCLSANERTFHFTWPQCPVCAPETLILSDDGNTLISTQNQGSTGKRMTVSK
jgi:hypothetical protein